MPPTNDNIANAATLTVGDGTLGSYDISDATTEGGEPGSGGSSNHSVWFRFTAQGAGTVHLSTYGSLAGDADSGDGNSPPGGFGSLDTVMAVWTGDTFPTSLHSVNDDSATDPDFGYWSELSIGVAAGVTYWVQVGTFDPDYVGTVFLSWEGVPQPDEAPPFEPPTTECLVQELFGGAGFFHSSPAYSGFGALIYDVDPADGNLLIAVATQWNVGGGTPSSGVISGLGGVWDLIYSHAESGTLSEVYITMQPSYSSGQLTYTFGADYGCIGFKSLTHALEAGLSDNGASAIRNLTDQGGGGGSSAAYTQATPYADPDSHMWSTIWRRGANNEIQFWEAPPNTLGEGDEEHSARGDIATQTSISSVSAFIQGPEATWYWDPAGSSTWWAVSLEVISDGCQQPYWGVLTEAM